MFKFFFLILSMYPSMLIFNVPYVIPTYSLKCCYLTMMSRYHRWNITSQIFKITNLLLNMIFYFWFHSYGCFLIKLCFFLSEIPTNIFLIVLNMNTTWCKWFLLYNTYHQYVKGVYEYFLVEANFGFHILILPMYVAY